MQFLKSDSNTLIFQKLHKVTYTNLTTDSIIIDNNFYSDNSWVNSIESIQKALDLVKTNGTIYISNINKKEIKTIVYNKTVTLIGNNTTYKGI